VLLCRILFSNQALQKIKNWFHNHRHHGQDSDEEAPKYKKVWKLRTVVAHMEKTKVEALARQLSGAAPGDPKYLGQYPKALSEVIEGLSEEKEEEYRDLADLWNRVGASESAKQK
jgi:hypothetical protein